MSPKPKVTIQRCSNLTPTIFSNAIYTIDRAIKVSIRGGNHRAFGATPKDALIRVIECATVKEVTTGIKPRMERKGITKQKRETKTVNKAEAKGYHPAVL